MCKARISISMGCIYVVDCPTIYKDSIHNTISFIEISTMTGTRKLVRRQLQRRGGFFWQKFLIDFTAYVHIF